jgi:hypothetical protein
VTRRKLALFAALLFPVALMAGCSHPQPVYAPPPPPAYSPAAQQGYHDGVQAARADIRRGMPPDLNRHPRFRRPPMGPPEEYRRGFREGYAAVTHGAVAPGSPSGY